MSARAWLALIPLLSSVACSRGTAGPEDVASGPATVAGAAGNVSGGGSGAAGGGAPGEAELPTLRNDTAHGVFVHLFEWRWQDVALECEQFLGPHGYTAVQVSPPSEHAVLAGHVYPWWQRYQTVSYALESRSGTRAEFVDMVARCRRAGVGIYVDAILNHTTGQTSGVGSAGTQFTKYQYPGLYEQADFHAPVCQIQASDYANHAEHVQRCELLALSDLDTAKPSVQQKLADYLSELLALGVRGFRLDAAKHIAPADLAGILALVRPARGEEPYYFLEVIDYGGEAIRASDYLDVGGQNQVDITEFKYDRVSDAFVSGDPSALKGLDAAAGGWLPDDRAVVFVDNHDTQRGDALFYQDGARHHLAVVFMLAWPYGYPSVMSSYGFDRGSAVGRAAGPPSAGMGETWPVYDAGAREPSCVARPYAGSRDGWICEHRAPPIAAMVGFRKVAGDAPVERFTQRGAGQIAFSRGDRGFVAINLESEPLRDALPTGLAPGRYCDVLSGGLEAARCVGATIEVDADGNAALDVAPHSGAAIHVAARL